ncbi:hypothetical protein SCLCIDRAFT_1221318 [Scleroderma citrinum Foug A]|uniref:Uncharacterized protein n=1 Tax=Scleroderma citrinum Foug A TaxID=1036808 RepID=A0A0C2Z034_9AGAM|nr:hypothetical protein SCLCIDRAFT_1221318 [Scleroderma citrinum Foug A]
MTARSSSPECLIASSYQGLTSDISKSYQSLIHVEQLPLAPILSLGTIVLQFIHLEVQSVPRSPGTWQRAWHRKEEAYSVTSPSKNTSNSAWVC